MKKVKTNKFNPKLIVPDNIPEQELKDIARENGELFDESFKLGTKYRAYCFTAFPKDKTPMEFDDSMRENIQYCVTAPEYSKTGKFHWQGYIELKTILFTTAKALLTKANHMIDVHLYYRIGTPEQAILYCTGPFVSTRNPNKTKPVNPGATWFGIPKVTAPGQRVDIQTILEHMSKGMTVDEFYNIEPEISVNHERKVLSARAYWLRQNAGERREVKVEVHWGEPRTGKSMGVYKEFGGKGNAKAFWFNPTKGSDFFTWYDGQKVIVLDEFSPDNVDINLLKKIMDDIPFQLNAKYGTSFAQWNRVIITTNYDPNDWYKHSHVENRLAVMKRIDSSAHYYRKKDKVIVEVEKYAKRIVEEKFDEVQYIVKDNAVANSAALEGRILAAVEQPLERSTIAKAFASLCIDEEV